MNGLLDTGVYARPFRHKEVPVRPRTLRVLVFLLAVYGVARTQQPTLPAPSIAPQYIPPQDLPRAAPAPSAPTEQSLDQMLDRLEAIQAKKAELAKMEQDVLKAIRHKMKCPPGKTTGAVRERSVGNATYWDVRAYIKTQAVDWLVMSAA